MSGMLSNFVVVTGACAASILFGVLISLVALIPPIRRFGQRGSAAGKVLIGLLALFAFVAAFGLSTRLFAEAMYRSVAGTIDQARVSVVAGSRQGELIEEWDKSKGVVVTELWLRQLTPPRDDPGCRTGRIQVCDLMGELGIFGAPGWGIHLLFVGMAVLSALASAWFTRKIISAGLEPI